MTDVPMVALPDLFAAQMLKGSDRDAQSTANTVLEAVYAAWAAEEGRNPSREAERRLAVRRGKAALELLEAAEKARKPNEQYHVVMKKTLILLMQALLYGWFASEDEADTDRFEAALLHGYPRLWMAGSGIGSDEEIYKGLGEDVRYVVRYRYHNFDSKLLRMFARKATDTRADHNMLDLTMIHGLPNLGHDWLAVMAQYAQAWHANGGHAPPSKALAMSLEHARAIGQSAAALHDLPFGLRSGEAQIIGPHMVRLPLWSWYAEQAQPSRYEREFQEYQTKMIEWRKKYPAITVELVYTVKKSDGSVWHEFKCRIE